ncbi:MAG: hypothetical protein KC418_14960 [Anaerolineales bacterium]|nr:hypothetical protein [Anaerolineales bacterium]MCB8954536.1 hypothetical protein [Ardenticatenales bacterium]
MSNPETTSPEPWDNLARLPRPSSFTLGEYALGMLPPAAAAQVEAYLALHPHAAAEVALLRDYLAQGEPIPAAPPEPPRRLQAVIMRLLDAATPQGAWAGARGSGAAAIYQAGDWQIILDSDDDWQQPGRFVLTGLLLGSDTPAQATATLLAADTPAFSAVATLDEFGNFVIPALPPGRYDLALLVLEQDVELHVAGIFLGTPPTP